MKLESARLAHRFALALAVAVAATNVIAQPRSTGEVFKCTINGKVVYTDEPCLGAERVDVGPPVKSGPPPGKQSSAHQDGTRPPGRMSRERYEIHKRRIGLTADARLECADLDRSIAKAELEERLGRKAKSGAAREGFEKNLLALRVRYRGLGC